MTEATNTRSDGLALNYDVVVIGGGIQGCGCAQAFAACGYSVLLVEQNTLGSGTSCRSSKLIHGGLRYLETGQFSLVRKSLHERTLLCTLAPQLVELKPFYIPVYKSSRLGRWKLAAGLSLYSLLGNLHRNSRFSVIPKSEWQLLPGLRKDGLLCVYRYYDAQTDDQLLTQAVASSASNLGATIIEQCSFLSADKMPSGEITVRLQYKNTTAQQHEAVETSTRLVINAAGPWVERVQHQIRFAHAGPKTALVQGSHIELDKALGDSIFYVESPQDRRPVFIMPWQGRTLVGTTEKQHTGDPAHPEASDAEVDYLLQTLKHYFPAFWGQVIDQWAGLRVLPQPEKPASSAIRPFSTQDRDTVIHVDDERKPQLISLYGGKLTAYRVTAQKVLEKGMKGLGRIDSVVDTKDISL